MKKIIKKAFTLVELLVVIAILACLSTIGIIGFNAFKNKGKNAADTSTVATLNRYTQSYTVNETIHYPTKLGTILKEHGLDIFKLQAEQEGYRFGFDLNGKKFVLIDNEDNLVDSNASKLNVFAFVNNNTDLTRLVAAGYSIFAQDGEFDAAISTSTGFDSGLNEEFTAVNYTHSGEEQFATIYTNTYGTKLNVAASNDTVYHYGYSGLVTVSAVATASYDEYGTVGRLVNETDSSTGHIAIKSGAIVYQIVEASGDDYFVTVEAGATVYDDQGTKLSGTVDTRVEGVNDDKFDEDAPTTCEHAHTHIFSDGQYLYETCDTCGYTVLTVGSAKKSVSDGTNNTITPVMTYAADQVQVASSGGNVVIKEGQTPVSETPSVTDIDETKLSCDHEWSTTVETAATCAGTGSEHHECSKCHLSYDVTLAKDSNNHTEINDQGYCLGCDKHFSESYMISQGYICKTLKWTNGGEYNGHTYEREYIKTYHKTLESAQAAIAIGSDSLTEERTVYIIADTDQDIEITAKQVVIVNSGVNYTGTVTKPNEVEITSAVKCYAGSFTTAWSIASRLYTSTNNQVTLKLLGDCDVKGTLMTASGSKINLTVDLNGHNINYSGSSQLFQISSGCEMFKVTSSSTKGTINLGNKQLVLAYAAIEFNNVDINVTGNLSNNLVLTYSGSSFGVGLDNVNINIENMSSNVFCVYGALYLGEKCNINITGYLNSSLLSINSADSGSSGYKGYNGISIKGTTINVNEFKANSPFLSRNAGTAFELENATITLGNTDKEFINRLDGSATVVISGGTFSGFKTVSYGDCGKVITGGTWSCDPTKAVADGYHVVDNGNSTWSVVAD